MTPEDAKRGLETTQNGLVRNTSSDSRFAPTIFNASRYMYLPRYLTYMYSEVHTSASTGLPHAYEITDMHNA